MSHIDIHPRVSQLHPDIKPQDVYEAVRGMAGYMHRASGEWIEKSAAAYERGDYPHEDGQVYSGSHLDAVGKKRVTVVYPCERVQMANRLAKSKGMKPSEVYRAALDEYLERHGLTHA